LAREKVAFLVIEDRHELVDRLRAQGIEAIHGNGAAPEVFRAANVAEARTLLIAIPDGFEAGQIAEQGRAVNRAIEIVARAHSDDEVDYLQRCGADLVIMGENEIARRMAERALGAPTSSPKGGSGAGIGLIETGEIETGEEVNLATGNRRDGA
jgi:CPA2 family monovalent cation:H+ antiporter-2